MVYRSRVEGNGSGRAGSVRTHGEIWAATSDERIEAGHPVRVIAVDGLRLHVAATSKESPV